jgi:hypothetical protein
MWTFIYTLFIGSNATCGSEELGGEHSPSRTEINPSSFEQGKHRLHNLLLEFASHFTSRKWLCIYVYEFYGNLDALGLLLPLHLVYPHDGVDDRMTILRK